MFWNSLKRISKIYQKFKPARNIELNRYIFGFVDDLNTVYTSGWVCDVNHIEDRLVCEAIISDTGEVLAIMKANLRYDIDISNVGDGKCYYAFFAKFSRKLNEDERDKVIIRIQGSNEIIPSSPKVKKEFQPFGNWAMDIVNNCNLRCPFCLYDYSSTKKTYFMSEAVLSNMLKFLPYVNDGEFWFSCLHEPALHPEFQMFLEKIPQEYRHKISFTTNLAKKMPDSYFEFLAQSKIDHINISIESFVPEYYMKFRKGARHSIFIDNLQRLVAAMKKSNSEIRLNYIAMAYKTNFKEFPEMYHKLMDAYNGSYFEMRETFDLPFIDQNFKDEEFLSTKDWDWLEDQFKQINDDRVVLYSSFRQNKDKQEDQEDQVIQEAPKEPKDPEKKTLLQKQYTVRVSWDGTIQVFAKTAHDLNNVQILETKIEDLTDPEKFYHDLEKIEYVA